MRKYLYLPLITIALLTMGLALQNCGDNEGTKECETNQDCVDKYGAGSWCDRTVWECRTCSPNCTGLCCGDDGCGGTCPDNCPTGYFCDTDCACKEDVECTTDQECVNLYGANYTCNLVSKECECNANCSGKCCGDDGCGATCPDNCTAPMTCNTTTCACEGCTDDSQCGATECCINGTCTAMACGTLECGPDPVCGKECGPCQDPLCCENGACTTCPTIQLCPSGQECTQVGSSGSMGCVIPPSTVPPGNETDCADDGCDGNYLCYCQDETCSASQCVENCGECTGTSTCQEVTPSLAGYMGCLEAGGGIPADAQFGCGQTTPCNGNATCWCTEATCTDANNVCIANCSTDRTPCTDNDTRCAGDTVQTCSGGSWSDTTDCTTSSLICVDGACITPPGLGEFCEDTAAKCAGDLDCIGTDESTHSFCTDVCDCTQGTGCQAGWECLLANTGQTTCWCAKLCTTAADCPDGGAGGYTCEVLAQDPNTSEDIYGCMIN
jgi:hypothetical protein